jgi:hypothetical protein
MRRPVPAEINAPFERETDAERRCQVPGCVEEGAHRAPVARDRLTQYFWFCQEHVRAYNLAWDFYAGMNEQEIEHQRRFDTVWQRPSWPFGHFGERTGQDPGSGPGADHTGGLGGGPRGGPGSGPGGRAGYRVHDGFGFFSEGPESGRYGGAEAPLTDEQKALALLDLQEPVCFADVKARYLALVKQLHPDANGGDLEAEERLKIVNQAYGALKISFA